MRSSSDSDTAVDDRGDAARRAGAVTAAVVGRRRRRVVAVTAVVVALATSAVILVLQRDDRGWAIDAAGGRNRLVAGDGTVCGTNSDHGIFCLDGATGEERFADELVDRPVPLAIVDGTYLVGADTGGTRANLLAYSLEGDVLWETALDDPLVEPAVADGVVAVRDEQDSELVGLDLATGDERWRATVAAPPADSGDRRIAGEVFSDGRSFYVAVVPHGVISGRAASAIVAVDAASGTERWRSELPGADLPPGAAAPFDDGSAVAFTVGQVARHHRVVVLDTATGRLRWQAPLGDAAATVAHVQGVTVALFGRELRAYRADGDELWATDAPTGYDEGDDINTSVLLLGRLFEAGDALYLHSRHVYGIDPATGETRAVIDGSVGDVVATGDLLVTADSCCQVPERIEAHVL